MDSFEVEQIKEKQKHYLISLCAFYPLAVIGIGAGAGTFYIGYGYYNYASIAGIVIGCICFIAAVTCTVLYFQCRGKVNGDGEQLWTNTNKSPHQNIHMQQPGFQQQMPSQNHYYGPQSGQAFETYAKGPETKIYGMSAEGAEIAEDHVKV